MPEFVNIPIDLIDEPDEPDRMDIDEAGLAELANSIQALGLLQPISVVPKGNGRYELVAGHRRLLAVKRLGWTEVPAHILDARERVHEARFAENIIREDLSPIEIADALLRMQQRGKTIHEIAEAVGKSPSWVKKYLSATRLPKDLIQAVHEGKVTLGAALQLARIEDREVREYYTRYAQEHGASERLVAEWVRHYLKEATREEAPSPEQAAEAYTKARYEVTVNCEICGTPTPLSKARQMFVCEHCYSVIARVGSQTTE